MAYTNLEARRAWFRRRYRRRHEWELERARRYRAENREILSQRSLAYVRRKQAEDPTYRVKMCCQTGWSKRCRRAKVYHAESFLELLGCTWEAFVRHVERRFRPGMTWQNFGEWTLDHGFPVSAFNLRKREERAMCSHFKNLSPMWAEENRAKNGAYCKADLERYKLFWRTVYGPKPKQLKFADRPECPF